MNQTEKQGKRRRMDDETALAFAGDCFQQIHPQSSCPEWLERCTSIGYSYDTERRFVVSFCVTPIITNDAVCYFKVSVDPHTAQTTVLLDRDLTEFVGETLQGFVPFAGHPWAPPPVVHQ